MNIYDILKDSAYKTEQFANEAIAKLNEKIVVKEDHFPYLTDTGAIVKVLGCGLCGSDIVKYRQHLVQNGTVLGHEIVGEIIDINSKTKFKIGDKIVSSHHIPCFKCNYCQNAFFV